MKAIIIALLVATSYSYSLDTLWTHNRGLHGASIDKAEFSPDESIIVLASDHGIKAVSTETGETIWNQKMSYVNRVTNISTQNTFILLAAYEGGPTNMELNLIDALTGEVLDSPFKDGLKVGFTYLSRDGTLFTDLNKKENNPNIDSDDESFVTIYDMTGKSIFTKYIGKGSFNTIITPDNKYLLAYGGYEDLNGVRKYNIETGKLEHHFNPIDTLFDYVEISEDGRYLFCSNKVDPIYLFNLETNEELFTFIEKQNYNWGEDFYYNESFQKFSYNHIKNIKSGIPTGNFSVYDINSGEKEFTLINNPDDLTGIVANNERFILANGVGDNLRFLSMTWEPTSVGLIDDNVLSITPNPSSEFVLISYLIENPSNIILSINDVLGNQLDIIDEGLKTPNNYEINYNLNNIPSGTYFITLQINDNVLTKQFIKE